VEENGGLTGQNGGLNGQRMVGLREQLKNPIMRNPEEASYILSRCREEDSVLLNRSHPPS
jgi:hypothetical protein